MFWNHPEKLLRVIFEKNDEIKFLKQKIKILMKKAEKRNHHIKKLRSGRSKKITKLKKEISKLKNKEV